MSVNLYNPHLRVNKTTQSIMRDVCIALLPAAIGSVIFFGVNSLIIILASVIACVACEAIWELLHKQPLTILDFSAVVTGMLIAFNVSSQTPLWVVVLAAVFSIIVVKQFFGGIGSNVLNPALMGRLFMMVVYPGSIMSYALPNGVDASSAATILSGGEANYSFIDAFIGRVPGALGETSALLLLIGFAYLVYKKEVNVQISGAFFLSAAVMVAIMYGPSEVLMHLVSGGLVLGGCFMLTDYNLAQSKGNVLLGVVAGILVVIFRKWAFYPEGVCYAILIVNTLSVLISGIKDKHIYGVN